MNSSEQFFDTLSSTVPVLTIAGSGTSTSPMTFTYTAPSGASAYFQANYTNYTVATNFGVSGIAEYKSSAAVPLVSSIVLADGTQYSFQYEPTPSTPASGACTPYAGTTCVTARVTSITLPTGGTISYSYTGGSNGVFSDGSTAGLKRYTPDTSSNYWNYARTAGTGAAYTTTVTDPVGNNYVIQFQGIYETQRQIYQGSVSSSNLLETITTCYNANTSSCTSTAIALPITQRSITTLMSGGLQSEHDDFWNTYGGPTETDDYDYGSAPHGVLLKKVLATYATTRQHYCLSTDRYRSERQREHGLEGKLQLRSNFTRRNDRYSAAHQCPRPVGQFNKYHRVYECHELFDYIFDLLGHWQPEHDHRREWRGNDIQLRFGRVLLLQLIRYVDHRGR